MRPIFAAAAALLVVLGCAHARRERVRGSEAPASSSAPLEPPDDERGDTGDSVDPEGDVPRAPADETARLDSSEEITPEELATIPEPVPSSGGASRAPSGEPPEAGAPRRVGDTPSGDFGAPAPSERVWSVQIYASESREEAERVARRAETRLGVVAAIDDEPPLHKVRLGSFATESEAQALRERAVRSGYPGAFRTARRLTGSGTRP